MKLNPVFSRNFLRSLFIKQNQWHRHSVLVHTLRVTWYCITHRQYQMIVAGLLHDVGKPYTAKQTEQEDVDHDWYSFKNHEEMSYQIIKDWRFISDDTKQLVRYHYLIRDLHKSRQKEPKRHRRLQKVWDKLEPSFKEDLKQFLILDDKGKGLKR